MTHIDELKQQELNNLNINTEEVGLEQLILMGEDKKIQIHITYPNADGTTSKAKALIKQLTLKEIENLNLTDQNPNMMEISKKILQKALYKSNGEKFTQNELEYLPIGMVKILADKILELSGVDIDKQEKIKDF